MSKQIINITLLVATEEVDDFLDDLCDLEESGLLNTEVLFDITVQPQSIGNQTKVPKQIINITLLVAIEELKSFLDDLYHSEQFGLPELKLNISRSELRQKLIDCAIGKIPNRYELIDWVQSDTGKTNYRYSSLEQRLYIETLIHDVIVEVLPETMLLTHYMQQHSNRNADRASGLVAKVS
jgi:hypothetical protein